MMSVRAARSVTKVSSEDRVRVKGLSGEVNKTYSADKAMLQFANIRQPNQTRHNRPSSGLSKSLESKLPAFWALPSSAKWR